MKRTVGKSGKRIMAFGMVFALVISVCSVSAFASEPVGSGVHATYDEAYYGLTDYYGNLTDGSVVKSYVVNGSTSLTDYGTYDEVINLTDGTVPSAENGSTVFNFAEGSAPSHFYFEGKTSKPFEELPWTISMQYTLNGVPTQAEDLAGKTGVVEIFFDAMPNPAASQYAKYNYTLEAMAIFNQDDILSLEAPGAQVQLVGNLRAVLFIVLPGEEQHFSIRVGSDDFSFGGMTFLMVPATLSQLEEISKLSERKDDLEDNYNKLSGSLDTLLDSLNHVSGSLYATANGLDELDQARETISAGKDDLYTQADTVLRDFDTLSNSLSTLPGHLDQAALAVDDTTKALDKISDSFHDLQDQMNDTKDDLDDLQAYLNTISNDSDNAADSLKDLGQLADSLQLDTDELLATLVKLNIQIGGGDITLQGMDAAELQAALAEVTPDLLNSVDGMRMIYRSVGNGDELTKAQFLVAGLIAAGSTAAEAQAKIAQVNQLTTAIQETALNYSISENAAKAAVYASAGLTAEEIAAYEEGAEKLALLGSVYDSCSVGGKMNEDQFLTAMIYMSGMVGVPTNPVNPAGLGAAQKKVTLLGLYEATQGLTQSARNLSKLLGYRNGVSGDLSRLLADVSDLLDEMDDISDTADDMMDTLDNTLTAADELHAIVNAYAPGLKATLTETKDTVTSLTNTVTDTGTFLTAFKTLMQKAGTQLDSGSKKTLEGLAASLRATARSLGTTGDVKTAKQNISEIIEDTWDEYTGDVNNLLLMDATAEAESLTDSRNPAPTSVQILIRTQEIKADEAAAEDLAAAEAPQTTFFGRVAQMFKDFWAAITGIFH